MRSRNRGGSPALPPAEAAVTYSRIEDEDGLDAFDGDGRREPTFTAMRVDPPQRRRGATAARVDLDEYDDGPVALDPEALGARPSARRPRPRRRGSRMLRLVLLVGALAVLGGIGVLGATAIKVIYGAPTNVAAAPAPDTQANDTAADPTAAPVTTATSMLPDSGSAGPGVLAIPASQGGPIDMTPAAPAPSQDQSQAALEPAPDVAAAPPPGAAPAAPVSPVSKPANASAVVPPLPKPATAAPATAAAPTTGTDAQIDNAFADIDRLLAEKKLQPATAPEPASTAPPGDQSAALNSLTPDVAAAPPLPATAVPVPPADIPNPTN